MAIPEKQLETWSHQGSITQSASTYAAVRKILEDPRAPYAAYDFEIFLQGSYANTTNIYADSDVDIVLCLTSTFHPDLRALPQEDVARYKAGRADAAYPFAQFKKDVVAWLAKNFGDGVRAGKKAIYIPGDGARRECDVLACIEHRRYRSYRAVGSQDYHPGICFWTSDGTYIVNFPKQHSANCTSKHANTLQWFKPNVRILKNMRNAMVRAGYIGDGRAPSYFLEGMLWNVPDESFGQSYQDCFVKAHKWLSNCAPSQLACANDLHWLLRDNQPVCWNERDFNAFLDGSAKLWNGWGA